MAFSHAVSLDEALQKLKQKYSPCYEFAHLLQYSWYHSAQVFIWWFEKCWYLNQDTNIGCTFSAFQIDIGTGFQELEQVGWIQSLTAIIVFPACHATSQETAVPEIPFGFLMEISLSRKGLEIPWSFYPWWRWRDKTQQNTGWSKQFPLWHFRFAPPAQFVSGSEVSHPIQIVVAVGYTNLVCFIHNDPLALTIIIPFHGHRTGRA